MFESCCVGEVESCRARVRVRVLVRKLRVVLKANFRRTFLLNSGVANIRASTAHSIILGRNSI